MQPAKYDLSIYRGDSYSWRFTLWEDPAATIPVDLTGVVPKAEIRNTSAGIVYATLALTVTGNEIVADLSAADSALIAAKGVWDLQLTFANGDVRTVVTGAVAVTADVTDSIAAPVPASNDRELRATYSVPKVFR